jgi:hypothetical protein
VFFVEQITRFMGSLLGLLSGVGNWSLSISETLLDLANLILETKKFMTEVTAKLMAIESQLQSQSEAIQAVGDAVAMEASQGATILAELADLKSKVVDEDGLALLDRITEQVTGSTTKLTVLANQIKEILPDPEPPLDMDENIGLEPVEEAA